MDKPFFYHAIKVDEEICVGCSHCMNACPTEAIRIWNGVASIDENQCVDCGECHKVCPVSAIYVEDDNFESIFNYKHRVILFPSTLIGQFPENITASQVYSTLLELGFTHLYEVERAVSILNDAILEYQKAGDNELPLISSFCPAVVRLIQVKYPALVDNILKLGTPSDIAAMYYKQLLLDKGYKEKDIGIFYVTPCAAKIAAIQSPVGEEKSSVNGVINLNSLYNRIYKSIKSKKDDRCVMPEPTFLPEEQIMWSLTQGEASQVKGRSLAIDGIQNVMEFLEMVEDEEVGEIDYLECRACKEGCAGGILNAENRFLVVERLKNRVKANKDKTGPQPEDSIVSFKGMLKNRIQLGELVPRSMMMLDSDMEVAMRKMQEAQKIQKQLPNIDCSACGAPSCRALAEDIVKGNATLSHCVFIQNKLIKENEISLDTAFGIIDKVWGDRTK